MKNILKYTVLLTVFSSVSAVHTLACADNSADEFTFRSICMGQPSSDGGSSVRYSSGRASDSRFLQGRKSAQPKRVLGRGCSSARGLSSSGGTGRNNRFAASAPVLPALPNLPAASMDSERLTPSESLEWLEDEQRVVSAREALEWLEELNEQYLYLHEVTFDLIYKLHKYIKFVMSPEQLSGYQNCILYLLTGKISPVYNRAWDDDTNTQDVIEKPIITDGQREFLRKLLPIVSRQAILKANTSSLSLLPPVKAVEIIKGTMRR